MDEYVSALSKEIKRWGGLIDRPIDTIYIGGGTPSLLEDRIEKILQAVRESFTVLEDTEITAEANPETSEQFLQSAFSCGVNRLSFGVQSANEDELKMLGRTHTLEAVEKSYNAARKIGFKNISLDLMLGLPLSNKESLDKSIDFLCDLDPEHISAYILKVEPNTALAKQNLPLPSDDEVGDQYLFMCEKLKNRGYGHYEISNFANSGFESRHNLRYWQLSDYIGIGPSAHSLLFGERFFYERNLKDFIKNPKITKDSVCNETFEKLMLNLRLSSGIMLDEFFESDSSAHAFADNLCKKGLAVLENGRFSLLDSGMLVSNTIITEFLEML